MEIVSENKCFGGAVKVVSHRSGVLGCEMKFSIFIPAELRSDHASIIFLSGLTCTHENFTTKAGAYKKAAELGMIIVAPDTSPRGDNVPDDADSYDFGKGAGFYINASEEPWSKHYRMEDYIVKELRSLLLEEFDLNEGAMGVSGHSMGGHGALTLYMKYPDVFTSCSAFSPIVAPAQVPWGEKAFSRYIGDNKDEWLKHDASALVGDADISRDQAILIDQGLGDQFLTEQLKPEIFEKACEEAGQSLNLRLHDGYDHSYYFIQSFIDDHIAHHAGILKNAS